MLEGRLPSIETTLRLVVVGLACLVVWRAEIALEIFKSLLAFLGPLKVFKLLQGLKERKALPDRSRDKPI